MLSSIGLLVLSFEGGIVLSFEGGVVVSSVGGLLQSFVGVRGSKFGIWVTSGGSGTTTGGMFELLANQLCKVFLFISTNKNKNNFMD